MLWKAVIFFFEFAWSIEFTIVVMFYAFVFQGTLQFYDFAAHGMGLILMYIDFVANKITI